MADVFSTDVLTAVLQSLLGNPQFLLDRFFGITQAEASEQIHFDVMQGKRRVSPFVSPLVEGQVVASQGFVTNTFTPAYIKDKRVFDMNRPLKRGPGEQIGGTMVPADRLRALIAFDMQDQLNMLRRRLEVMCGEVLASGKSTISGDKYPTQVVDFQRSATHQIVAAPLWSTASPPILNNLQDWAQICLEDTGVFPNDVIMTVDVWKVFRADPAIVNVLNIFRRNTDTPSVMPMAQVTEGGVLMGNIEGFNIWVYSGWYVDPADGVEKPIIPAGTVIMCSPSLEGVQAYGAIRDEEIGLQPVPYYVKSWIQYDPSVRYVMLQSAPIMVPFRPNASLAAKVL
ncbi:MAG TPA: major capsid protein [Burkholderiales bacterium]|nr:major capsid protein [Burkholderiales bacterium]